MNRRNFLKSTMGALAAGFTPLPGVAQGARAPTGYIRTNWSRDPFSYGSYSYLAKGSWRRDHVALGRPIENRLFFAGEATHPSYNSTVHAAYESGIITAEAVFETTARKIGIVGAGMSGLAAADALVRQGYEVTIWEARDRIGGRVWTDDSLEAPLDLGASWIHGIEGNPLAQLAQERGVVTQVTTDSYVIRGGDGSVMRDLTGLITCLPFSIAPELMVMRSTPGPIGATRTMAVTMLSFQTGMHSYSMHSYRI